jgi:hypothetical protein
LGIGIEVFVLGISLGNFYGNLNFGGLGIDIDQFLATGSIKLYLKDGAVHLRPSMKVKFDGSWDEDIKLFNI